MNEAGKGDKRRNENTTVVNQTWDNINWSTPVGCSTNKLCEYPNCVCKDTCMYFSVRNNDEYSRVTKIPQTYQRANFNSV